MEGVRKRLLNNWYWRTNCESTSQSINPTCRKILHDAQKNQMRFHQTPQKTCCGNNNNGHSSGRSAGPFAQGCAIIVVLILLLMVIYFWRSS